MPRSDEDLDAVELDPDEAEPEDLDASLDEDLVELEEGIEEGEEFPEEDVFDEDPESPEGELEDFEDEDDEPSPIALLEDLEEDEPEEVADEDEDEEDDLDELRAGEFVCSSCHMAKRESALADPEQMLCRDCA